MPTGIYEHKRGEPLLRFFSKVDKTSSCWMWTGPKSYGYGKFSIGRKTCLAHRFAYERLKGQIPNGLQLDHLCRNKACVNPEHLEPVTNRENALRAVPFIPKTNTCQKGHELTTDNLVKWKARYGHKECLKCRHEYNRIRRQKTNGMDRPRLKP